MLQGFQPNHHLHKTTHGSTSLIRTLGPGWQRHPLMKLQTTPTISTNLCHCRLTPAVWPGKAAATTASRSVTTKTSAPVRIVSVQYVGTEATRQGLVAGLHWPSDSALILWSQGSIWANPSYLKADRRWPWSSSQKHAKCNMSASNSVEPL